MITVAGLKKTFNTGENLVRALDGVDLQVKEKEFFVLLGLSGSGKTTLLRCVAGLEKPEAGKILLGGQVVNWAERGVFVPAEDRGIGMVFQSYAVWPHMTVFDNVAFPLTDGRRRLSKSQVRDRVSSALEKVKLSHLAQRPAPFLSGGQQQRVALARALAVEPRVLLMDEPLSNLDARLREEVRDEIKSLSKELGTTVLYVTHDQAEAMALADKIAVINEGRILEVGTPHNLYHFPANRKVADFLGPMNEFEGTTEGDNLVKTDVGILVCTINNDNPKEIILAIRPEDVDVSLTPSATHNEFPAEIVSQVFLGDLTVYRAVIKGKEIMVKTSRIDPQLRVGCEVFVRFPTEKLKVFSR